jgi:hypothetical protein
VGAVGTGAGAGAVDDPFWNETPISQDVPWGHYDFDLQTPDDYLTPSRLVAFASGGGLRLWSAGVCQDFSFKCFELLESISHRFFKFLCIDLHLGPLFGQARTQSGSFASTLHGLFPCNLLMGVSRKTLNFSYQESKGKEKVMSLDGITAYLELV